MLDDGARFLDDARRAAAFVRAHLWDPASGTLLRRYRKGEAGVEGYAEDYAYLIFGLLELFQADGDPQWLEWALALQQRQDALFWDPVGGGWFSTTGKDRVSAPAAEGGLRRRRAGGELSRRAESADAGAPEPGAQSPEPRAQQPKAQSPKTKSSSRSATSRRAPRSRDGPCR